MRQMKLCSTLSTHQTTMREVSRLERCRENLLAENDEEGLVKTRLESRLLRPSELRRHRHGENPELSWNKSYFTSPDRSAHRDFYPLSVHLFFIRTHTKENGFDRTYRIYPR